MGLARVPNLEQVGIHRHHPPQDDGVKIRLVDAFFDKYRPFQQIGAHIDTDLFPGILGNSQNRLSAVIAAVGDQGEFKALAVLFKPAVLIGCPTGLGQQFQSPGRIIGGRLNLMIVIIGLFDKGAGDSFPLAGEHVLDNLVHVDGHGQCPAHTDIIEGLSAHVVADVTESKGGVGYTLIARIVLKALNLVGGDPMGRTAAAVDIQGAGIKFHFLG